MADEVIINTETGEEQAPEKEELVTNQEQEDHDEDSGDEGEEEESLAGKKQEPEGEETDEEREAIRERRRAERQHRKQAQKEREESLRREISSRDTVINEMRARLDAVERRNSGSELAQIQNAKEQTARAYSHFKEQIRIATEAGNGALVADATEKMMQAQSKFDELNRYEHAYKQRAQTPPPLDPRLRDHAQRWMESNKWYDPTGRDTDSRITAVLDAQLEEEGWDPTTPQYWDELNQRVKKHLPHRALRATVTPTKPKSVVAGSGREVSGAKSNGNNGSGSYTLSAERVQALKDADLWDDPKQRAEAVKRYREFDKEQAKG